MPQKSSNKASSKAALAENFRQLEDVKELFEKGSFLPVDIEKFPIATCITDKEGIFVQVNSTYCSIMGYSSNELIGKNFTILIPSHLQKSLADQHQAFIQGKEEFQSELEIINKSGETKFIICNASLFKDRKQEPFKASFIIDVTKIKESEIRFKETSDAMVKDLDAREITESMLMHDMRKPVANIVGICNLLLKAEPDPEKMRNWINILKQEATKSLRLLDTKAGFKRMELNTYQLELSEFDIIRTIRNIVLPLEPKLLERSNQCTIMLHEKVCREDDQLLINGDEFFIEIMLNNLIVNALEASPENEEVTISLTTENRQDLRIGIHNKGVIPEEIRDRFFDKYTTFGKAKGLGIGTYTSKIIAKAHQGDISFITSEEEGSSLHVLLKGVVKSGAEETSEPGLLNN